MSQSLTTTVLTVGVPTFSGIAYSLSVCELIVKQFEALTTTRGLPGYNDIVDLEHSHIVDVCWMQENRLMVSYRFMATLNGQKTKAAWDKGLLYMAPRGHGSFHGGTTFVNCQGYIFDRFDLHHRPAQSI